MCSLRSRLRRVNLYRAANRLGGTKIALGRDRGDILQALLLNLLFDTRPKGLPPKLVSDDGWHVVIRPIAHVAEKDLVRWVEIRARSIISRTLCASQENLQRKQVGNMLREWDVKFPGQMANMSCALQKAVSSHLMGRGLHPFQTLPATGVADDNGDKAFDDEHLLETTTQGQGW
jgi:tRNA 2-thiocytidine biosynthesis protein TtcA